MRTALALVEKLKLPSDRWSISFQSRLGRSEWLGPYTEDILVYLGKQGKRVAIVSPSFVSDGLETLEELNMRGRESFMGAGGADFCFVPSLNSHPEWVTSVAKILTSERGWRNSLS